MRLKKVWQIAKEVIKQLFPDCLAYTNFIMMIAFLLATVNFSMAKQTLHVLISALGTIYCLNEWDRRIKKHETKD